MLLTQGQKAKKAQAEGSFLFLTLGFNIKTILFASTNGDQ
jgi:hypothetical protein